MLMMMLMLVMMLMTAAFILVMMVMFVYHIAYFFDFRCKGTDAPMQPGCILAVRQRQLQFLTV